MAAAGGAADLNNFKGYHNNNDKAKQLEASHCSVTGAHFKHSDIFTRLLGVLQNKLQEKKIEKLTGEKVTLDQSYYQNKVVAPTEISIVKL